MKSAIAPSLFQRNGPAPKANKPKSKLSGTSSSMSSASAAELSPALKSPSKNSPATTATLTCSGPAGARGAQEPRQRPRQSRVAGVRYIQDLAREGRTKKFPATSSFRTSRRIALHDLEPEEQRNLPLFTTGAWLPSNFRWPIFTNTSMTSHSSPATSSTNSRSRTPSTSRRSRSWAASTTRLKRAATRGINSNASSFASSFASSPKTPASSSVKRSGSIC